MYLVAIAWLYVTLMMAVAEAGADNGTVLGAVITFVLYGLLPLSILLYILGTPARKRRLRVRQQRELQQAAPAPASVPASVPASAAPPDEGRHAPAAAQDAVVAPVRKKP